eukprot:TRINITY_DN50358_c0_g1_i2.p1 TRINITY_DN50358_c0_g1~~TRINITY_DN50358_c0_g1_i2.p1  ORF type:complete len:438 (+),score=61.93 TRINITY_DN50358_c0_g1_i2:93-1406(+)
MLRSLVGSEMCIRDRSKRHSVSAAQLASPPQLLATEPGVVHSVAMHAHDVPTLHMTPPVAHTMVFPHPHRTHAHMGVDQVGTGSPKILMVKTTGGTVHVRQPLHPERQFAVSVKLQSQMGGLEGQWSYPLGGAFLAGLELHLWSLQGWPEARVPCANAPGNSEKVGMRHMQEEADSQGVVSFPGKLFSSVRDGKYIVCLFGPQIPEEPPVFLAVSQVVLVKGGKAMSIVDSTSVQISWPREQDLLEQVQPEQQDLVSRAGCERPLLYQTAHKRQRLGPESEHRTQGLQPGHDSAMQAGEALSQTKTTEAFALAHGNAIARQQLQAAAEAQARAQQQQPWNMYQMQYSSPRISSLSPSPIEGARLAGEMAMCVAPVTPAPLKRSRPSILTARGSASRASKTKPKASSPTGQPSQMPMAMGALLAIASTANDKTSTRHK